MKKICLLLVLVMLTLVTGCSEETATGPEDGDDYILEATETIGSGGGMIEVEDFSMAIPAGAFDADYSVELHSSSEDLQFGENQVTRAFRMRGLPAEYAQPLRVSIQFEGAIAEESCIGQGLWSYDALSGDSTVVYRLHAAIDSSGHLVCQLPARQESTTTRLPGVRRAPENTADEIRDEFLVGIGYFRQSVSEHFHFWYPALVVGTIGDLAEILEGLYGTVVDDMGLYWVFPEDYNDEDMKVWVVVRRLPQQSFAHGIMWEEEVPLININEDKMGISSLPALRIKAGIELLRTIMDTQDPLVMDSAYFLDPARLWLHVAVLTWAEERSVDDPSYRYPELFPTHEMAPFNGMQKGAAENPEHHGYGMSAMIKYLVTRYGDGITGSIYQQILNGALVVDAVRSSTEDPNEWLEEFFREYVLGNIYDVPTQYWASNAHETFSIRSGDAFETFSDTYPELGARLYRIDLDYPDIASGATITFTATGPPAGFNVTTVFRYNESTIEFMDYDIDPLQITNVRDLTDGGWDLLAVVTNVRWTSPYTYTDEIDLKIEVIEPLLDYDRCGVSVQVFGHFRFTDADDGNTTDRSEEFAPSSFTVDGITSGNIFTGTHQSEWASAEVTAVFNSRGDTLVSLDWEYIISATYAETTKVNGFDIPLYDVDTQGTPHYTVEDIETCNHIDTVKHIYVSQHGTDVMIGHDCNENSRIYAYFRRE